MTEIIYPRGGEPVTLRECPAWCTLSHHFAGVEVVDIDDGFHHEGPEVAIPTSDQMSTDDPYSVVKVTLRAWTHPLDADPGPGHVTLALESADMGVDLMPEEARAVAAALIQLADTAADQ